MKEARESLYWLRLMQKAGIFGVERVGPLIQETDELISIITAIVVRKKQNRG